MVCAGDAIKRHDLQRLNLPANCPTGKSRKPVQPSRKKYSACRVGQISGLSPRVSPDKRGGSRSSRNARWDAVDVEAATDESGRCGRQNRVVLAPRCWRQVREKQTLLRGDGGKQAGRRGERAISRKTIAQGRPDASAEPVCSCACFCACLHTRPRVQRAPGLPCALCVSRGCEVDENLGRTTPRECGRVSAL
jgi:hypothetical protein